ncbi:MAG: M23 family metallopeptidase [Actinobacteria bacterium]|nr:M23 family metallopeptidase [Actinomycetota bacterium]
MPRHRTTTLGVTLLVIGLAAGPAAAGRLAAAAAPRPVPPLIFPVVGPVTYGDDFGDARGQGSHEGNDILAPKRSPVVAVEAGTVRLWTTSTRAGCMIELRGSSGTSYRYIHLNNDATAANDNSGGCVVGVAYAAGLRTGARVTAGEPIGYVGDSGDADGGSAHLHFEVHPGGGGAVSPYRHLRLARKLLFAAAPGKPFTVALRGRVAAASVGSLTLSVDRLQAWPGSVRVTKVGRPVELMVPGTAALFDALGTIIASAKLATLEPGEPVVAWTARTPATLSAQLGEPLALVAERIVLR